MTEGLSAPGMPSSEEMLLDILQCTGELWDNIKYYPVPNGKPCSKLLLETGFILYLAQFFMYNKGICYFVHQLTEVPNRLYTIS